MMVLPRVSWSMACWIRCSFSGSMLAVASSRMMMGGVLQDGAGDGDALLLAAGESAAALAHHGVIAVGQRHDEIVAAGFFGGVDHLGLGGIGLAEEDVGPDGVVEQVHVLEHHGDVGEQAVAGELLQAVAAHGDGAELGIVEPGQQAADGGLAAAGGADNGGGGLFGDGEGNILQHLTGIVSEVDAVEGDIVWRCFHRLNRKSFRAAFSEKCLYANSQSEME